MNRISYAKLYRATHSLLRGRRGDRREFVIDGVRCYGWVVASTNPTLLAERLRSRGATARSFRDGTVRVVMGLAS